MNSFSAKLADKHIIVISTYTIKKKFIFQRLKQLGCKVTVVNKEKNWATPYVYDWILSNTTDHDMTIRMVGEYLENNQVDGILTFLEDDVLLTSKLTSEFGMNGIPYEVAKKARNKFAFRQFCAESQIAFPKFKNIVKRTDLKTIVSEFQFPLVVKPAFGSSSSYVIKADDEQDLYRVYDFVSKNISSRVESSLSDGKQILVEEYIEGDEVDIDMLIQNGKVKYSSITDNYDTLEPFFVETADGIPSTLPVRAQQQLLKFAEEVLEKMGVYNGCIHFEAKYTKKGPIPIEVNLRMGGDSVYSYNKTAWHVDLVDGAVAIACGEYIPKIDLPEEPFTYMAGKYFLPQKSGVISQLDYPKKFSKKDQIQDFYFFKRIGDSVLTPPSDYEFLGWMTARGVNPNDARENLDEAYKKVECEIIPFSSSSAVGKTHRSDQGKAAILRQSPAILQGKARIEKIRQLDLKNQRQLHIGIACNSYSGEDGIIEADLSSVGNNIQKTLADIGYKTTYIDFNQLPQAIDILQKSRVDLVFNVCERINDSSLLEPHSAAILDAFNIPYTGSNPFTLGLCIDKIRVKKLLTYHGIPTAKWDYLYDISDELRDDLKFPLIVKPANTDNSIGVTNDSVVTNKKQLWKQIEYVMKELKRPVLVEEYLEGDEYDVSIIGSEQDDLQVLPLQRNIFNMPKEEGLWNIWTMEYKYKLVDTAQKYVTLQSPPKNVSKKLLSLISEIALDTYNILDCHDYGRVDIKLDADGNPHILELNPNPSINIGDTVPRVAELTGFNYGQFIERIIALSIKRYRDRPPYYHLQTNNF